MGTRKHAGKERAALVKDLGRIQRLRPLELPVPAGLKISEEPLIRHSPPTPSPRTTLHSTCGASPGTS
ncbi:hypothetical protein GCM10011579_093470 [Streptomyces albiflavescens]|uniref:Uncharacterized protein n=1 Tax=Streptomyces albiflavescens TaxID=1623582 RepID=A0A917YGK7_9ACTN|nr:hypothetical protein GCM10011579_093470 [Streptomyces albiflavescens]